VEARRRHPRSEPVEEFGLGEELRVTAAEARLRVVVDEVLAVELAQPTFAVGQPGGAGDNANRNVVPRPGSLATRIWVP
jgi:hypothetical protein